jgi:hypothetical protein
MPETVGMVLDRLEQKANQEIEIPPNGTSLDLLQAVYRSSSLPLTTRMRAAGLALPHEHPKLAVTSLVTEGDFAQILDRRIAHYKALQLGNGSKVIDAKANEPVDAEPAEVQSPSPTLGYYSRSRFNRRF